MLNRLWNTPRLHLPIALIVAAAVLFPWLGSAGFSSTEGLRVAPGWAMLQHGDWMKMEVFGAAYLRKPPGTPWTIAASTAVLGHTEFAARLPSALCALVMVAVAYGFASRWFGRPWGFIAGLVQALCPLMWEAGRAAEIEALNNLGTQLAALSLIGMMVPVTTSAIGTDSRRIERGLALCAMGIVGIFTLALAKGPSSLPVIAGVAVGACVARYSIQPLLSPWAIVSVLIGVGVSLSALVGVYAATGESAIRQSPGDFLWSLEHWKGSLTLIPVALASALPGSIALLALVQRKADDLPRADRRWVLARSLGWAYGTALVIYLVLGIHNARYVAPAHVLLAPLAGFAGWRASKHAFFTTPRGARTLAVGTALLLAAGVTYASLTHASRARNTGKPAGESFAAALPAASGPIEVWANDAVEARAEVLLMMQLRARERGLAITPLWKYKELLATERPAAGTLLLLRDDAESDEWKRYSALPTDSRPIELARASAHKYTFVLARAR